MFRPHHGKPAAHDETHAADLGLEGMHSAGEQHRLLNRDGTFTIQRRRSRWYQRINYHQLLTMSWKRFYVLACLFFVLINSVFAAAYLLCGPKALAASGPTAGVGPLWQAFFFSVHTFTTIGYGNLIPVGLPANLIVSVEAICSLLTSAITTGLVFARFSRVRARLRFSQYAVIDTSGALPSLQIRLTNSSSAELIDLSANLVFTWFEGERATSVRRFRPLKLERETVAFLPMGWTLTHVIDEASPIYGLTLDQMRDSRTEFMVIVTATDAGSSQAVHARTSYVAGDLRWGARHDDAYLRDSDGNLLGIDLDRFDAITQLEQP